MEAHTDQDDLTSLMGKINPQEVPSVRELEADMQFFQERMREERAAEQVRLQQEEERMRLACDATRDEMANQRRQQAPSGTVISGRWDQGLVPGFVITGV